MDEIVLSLAQEHFSNMTLKEKKEVLLEFLGILSQEEKEEVLEILLDVFSQDKKMLAKIKAFAEKKKVK
ncbi:MAG: hypothetical protein QXK06_01410 [Candidatus Diapherotrites archaeon]